MTGQVILQYCSAQRPLLLTWGNIQEKLTRIVLVFFSAVKKKRKIEENSWRGNK
jgi:hypothetical protein